MAEQLQRTGQGVSVWRKSTASMTSAVLQGASVWRESTASMTSAVLWSIIYCRVRV